MTHATAAILISIVAIVISALSCAFTARQANAAHKLTIIETDRRNEEVAARMEAEKERNRLEAEKLQARFVVMAENSGPGYKLRIKNVGRATARQIYLVFYEAIDTLPPPEELRRPIAVPDLTAGSSLATPISDSRGSHNYKIQVSWRDGMGDRVDALDVIV